MTGDQSEADFLVIGAGIAGATAGYALSRHGRVILLERESVPGYHTTGRSAAFFAETYGNEAVRRLTTASKAFFLDPSPDFTDQPLVRDRGALFIARADQLDSLKALYEDKRAALPSVNWVDRRFIAEIAPMVNAEYAAAGVWDPECRDIDVHALHQGYLRSIRAAGGGLATDAAVIGITWKAGFWRIRTADGRVFSAPIVINAAGAWGDEIAGLAGAAPLGLIPKRRTIIVFQPLQGPVRDHWPLVLDAEDQFYFKPECGKILASPGDATPLPPQDAQPDLEDVALAIARIEAAANLSVKHLHAKWAGLRTFAPDDTPVVGEDPELPGFYWFVGQGGFGMQTAPAMARLLESVVTEGRESPDLAAFGVSAALYDPRRFGPESRQATC